MTHRGGFGTSRRDLACVAVGRADEADSGSAFTRCTFMRLFCPIWTKQSKRGRGVPLLPEFLAFEMISPFFRP